MAAKFSRRKGGRDRFETHDARNVVAWGCQQGAAPNAESVLPGKVRLQEERTRTRRRQVMLNVCDPASFPSEFSLKWHSVALQHSVLCSAKQQLLAWALS
jgi:hypothetical protein